MSQEERSGTPTVDEKEATYVAPSEHSRPPHPHSQPPPTHLMHHQNPETEQHLLQNGYPNQNLHQPPPYNAQQQQQPIPGRPYEGEYSMPPVQGYRPYDQPPHGMPYNQGPRPPYQHGPPRGGYGLPPPHMRGPRLMGPPNSLASVYQGVAAKVGPGLVLFKLNLKNIF